MKITAVTDCFMKPEFYTECFNKYKNLECTDIVNFGPSIREKMRAMVDKIEKGGAYAVPVPEKLYDAVRDCEALMVHLCPVTKKVIESAPKLKYILLNRGGLENIDIDAARERGIKIIHNPAHNANAVAELTVALMICEMRNVARAHYSLKTGGWREEFPNFGRVFELRNKTVGIIGFGTIGRLVCEKLQPFNVKILAADPNVLPSDPDLARLNVTLTDHSTLLSKSDIVSLHARTLDRSLIIGKEQFDLMKPDATFINTARAYMVDYDYLGEILSKKRISGAALEVFPTEPLPKDSIFRSLDNVTLTNHRGGDTVNCYSDSPEFLLDSLFNMLENNVTPKYYIE